MECHSCTIKNLIYRYAHHIDSGDLESVAAMFDRGKVVAMNEEGAAAEIPGAAAVLALYRAFTRIYDDDHTPHTLHMTTNVVVDVAPGEESATASSYAMVFQALADFPLQPVIGVRYYDRFSRAGGTWHFAERRIDMRLAGDLSHHLLR